MNCLTKKFTHATDVRWIEQKAKEDPKYLFPLVVRANKAFSEWPDGIKHTVHMSNDNKHIYTFRITCDDLKKIGSLPEIESMTIR